ncbi:hypothetical protein LTR29_005324 [Friedmanniomyces endolithicus]|nr:hypothetical protein LTR29_005324 [Friedmanniomyces endolithicus]
MAQPWNYIAKIVSLGDSGSGKSSLTIRLCEGRFVSHHDVTIGVEFGSRVVPVGPPASLEHNINNPVASNKPPATRSPNDVKKSAGKGASAEPLQKFMKLSLWDTAGQETYKSITRSYFRVVILVGNKSDLAPSSTVTESDSKNKRQVTRQEAEDWCRSNRVMQYVETSAKSGDNVERAFLEVAERIYQNIEAGKYDLNDRRSGVKGPGGGGGPNAGRTVTLGGSAGAGAKKAGSAGGCC